MSVLCPTVTVRALSLDFPGPIGLAAGYDRHARHVNEVLAWGFGFVELGTITPEPEPGHNPGAAAIASTLMHNRVLDCAVGSRPVIGLNLGVQPGSPAQEAWRDFLSGMQMLWRHADYLVLNLTSSAARPLHAPAQRDTLLALLTHAQQERRRLSAETGRDVPLLIKWPVGPGPDNAVEVAHGIRRLGYDGLVAAFDPGLDATLQWEAWVPHACRQIAGAIGPRATLVAVGGIERPSRVLAVQRAGATLVQLYRGFEAGGGALVQELGRTWVEYARA